MGQLDILVNNAAYRRGPLGRVGQLAELAPAFVFFASLESSYVTGEVLAVTGGRPII